MRVGDSTLAPIPPSHHHRQTVGAWRRLDAAPCPGRAGSRLSHRRMKKPPSRMWLDGRDEEEMSLPAHHLDEAVEKEFLVMFHHGVHLYLDHNFLEMERYLPVLL